MTNLEKYNLLEGGETSANSIFIVQFNPHGKIIDDCAYFPNYWNNVKVFTDFESADSTLRYDITDYEMLGGEFDPERIICTITQCVIGEPATLLEKFIYDNYGKLQMTYDCDGKIIKYNLGKYEWTNRNLIPYNNIYKCGDIVDCCKDGRYYGRFVIFDKVNTIQSHMTERNRKKWFPGYLMKGFDPFNKTDELITISDAYNTNIIRVEETMHEDFYNALSVMAKCYNLPDRPLLMGSPEYLYDLYFVEEDIQEFNETVNDMESIISSLSGGVGNE